MGFDFRSMSHAVESQRSNPNAYISAESYFFEVK